MGILDQLGNLTPEQTQGLLAAGANMLQSSGASFHPTSFGQVLGGGVSQYQQTLLAAQKQKREQDEAQQMQQMRDLQIRGMQGDLAAKEALRQMQLRIQQRLKAEQGGAQSLPGAAQQFATSMSQMGAQGQQPAPEQGQQAAIPPDVMSPGAMPQAPAMQASPMQALAPMQGSQPQPGAAMQMGQDLTRKLVERLSREAQVRAQEGDIDGADKALANAAKFLPEVKEMRVGMENGKPVQVIVYKDGTEQTSRFGVAPKIHFADNGQYTGIPQNEYTGEVMGNGIQRQTTPGERLTASTAATRLAFDKQQAESNQDEPMDPLAVRMTAQQYLAGDSTALQNYGRGAQGAKNLNLVRREIARQANAVGLNGADIAAKVAEFQGVKSGQRTAGTRAANIEIAANEAAELAPLALEASTKVARSSILPFGKAQIMFDANSNDPNLRQFAMANNALVNAYGQVMARGGISTVTDKEHARELLSTAYDQPSYTAAVKQMQREIDAARKAPDTVRKDLSKAVSGRSKDSSGLSDAEQSELEALRNRFGRK